MLVTSTFKQLNERRKNWTNKATTNQGKHCGLKIYLNDPKKYLTLSQGFKIFIVIL